tara:strand:- start:878 stop:1069 length:192 start_codon:yes stop_codon:yes gene_type:complete
MDIIYPAEAQRVICIIDDLEMDGVLMSVFVPDDRRDDLDRNDVTRREVTALLEAEVARIEPAG